MTRFNRLLATASSIAISAFGATQAYAAGTTSGTSITNTVTVNYQVGGVAQTAINASNSFTVDRKVSLTVAEVGSATTTVVPGQSAVVTTFTVTNTSNSALDIGLAVSQPVGGVAQHGGTDSFDVTAPAMYVDTNANGVYDAGTDTAVTFLDEIAADATRTVFIVANVPAGAANGGVAGVSLTGQARDSGTAGSQGAILAATAGANTAGIDIVLADGTGGVAGDVNSDGLYIGRDDYTVSSATLTITKTSTVISDPVNGASNPKLIPGAVVEYCIQVANTGGSSATNVVVTDPVPGTITYSGAFGIFFNGTVTAGVCNADGTNPGGSFAAGTVTGTAMTVAAGATRTLYFRGTIN